MDEKHNKILTDVIIGVIGYVLLKIIIKATRWLVKKVKLLCHNLIKKIRKEKVVFDFHFSPENHVSFVLENGKVVKRKTVTHETPPHIEGGV